MRRPTSVRVAREQYSCFVAFVAIKSFTAALETEAERSEQTNFVAFSMLTADPIPKGTLCSPLRLRLVATLRARIQPLTDPTLDRAPPTESRCIEDNAALILSSRTE
jgi:hypothetical protein